MRIISGDLGGRVLHPPIKKWPTRPTTDRAREALFNILENQFDWAGLKALDLFGGTGLISFELISRGVEEVHYVENYAPAVEFVQQSAKELNVSDRLKVFQRDVFQFLEWTNDEYRIIFADPPYQLYKSRQLPQLIFEHQLLGDGGLLIIEHDATIQFAQNEGFIEQREYGQTILSFFHK